MRRRLAITAFAAILASRSLTACSSVLETENLDSPDVATTLSTPSGISAVTASLYQTIWTTNNGNPGPGSPNPIYPHMLNMSFESFAQQYAPMSVRNALPRGAILNTRTDLGAAERLRDFSGLSRNTRTAANVVIGLVRLVAGGRTLGSPALDARARSFAFFANGVSLGNLALAYDSAAIVTPSVPPEAIPPLSGAADVMKAALSLLDSAIVIAGRPEVAAAFPLPVTWISGRALSAADFMRVARSYRARFRAGIARTPAERAAVDWAAVINDVNGGITADFSLLLDPPTGWANSWITLHYSATYAVLHQMTPMILGMADTSGQYDEWLTRPLEQRRPFLIKTPDRRLPAGETRTIQIANSSNAAPPLLYFRNRVVANDLPIQNWGSSQYDHFRWRSINAAGGRGDFPIITKAEMDLLAAEGHLQRGEIAPAAARIDVYRIRAGLPALAGVAVNMSSPVPGGRACVPRVPTSAGNSTTCGTILEALKWEKRMETAFTGWASWYFDSRGWGDLPEGTPLEFPVPFQELDARGKPLYNLGGIGGKSAAPKGTYGL